MTRLREESVLADLLARGRYVDTLRCAQAVPPGDAGYAAARLVAVHALVEQARVPEAMRLLEDTPATVFNSGDDGRVLGLWRSYVSALALPAAYPDCLPDVAAMLDAAVVRPASPRCGVEAVALRARLTRLRILYAELPYTALRSAAEEFARAAAGYRELGLLPEGWIATRLCCAALRAIPDEPVEPVLALLEGVVAEARAGGRPLAEAAARLAALEIRTEVELDGTAQVDLSVVAAECAAVGALLEDAGHAFGQARAAWTVVAPLLRHGADAVVGSAQECAAALADAGAAHLASEVWRTLHQFHGARGDGTRQREAGRLAAAAVASVAAGPTEGRWQMLDLVEAISEAEALFRVGRIGLARSVADRCLAAAPHRSARVSLRVMLATQLSVVGLPEAARDVLRAALADLAPVAPAVLSGEVLILLAAVEVAVDLPRAMTYASQAVDAARRTGDLPAAGRYLTTRAQLLVQARWFAGQRPVLAAEAEADLAAAEELLAPLSTVEGRQALVGVYQARGQAVFFDDDVEGCKQALGTAEEMARVHGLVPNRAFVLAHLGMVSTQWARNRGDIAGYDVAAAALMEARRLFVEADMTQVAWRPRFLAANAEWEAARLEPEATAARRRLELARAGLEETAAELDTLRGVAGGDDALERQQVGIGFGVDKQELYRTGFRLAVHGLGDAAEAIRWLERMKSRALLDALATAARLPVLPDALAGNALLARERELLVERAGAAGFAELAAINRELNEVLDRLAADPSTAGYAALRRSEPPSWPRVRAALAAEHDRSGRRVVVAQYHCESGAVMLFGMAADWPQPRILHLPVDADELVAYTRPTFRTIGGVRMMMQDRADGGIADWHRFAGLVAPISGWAGPDDVVYLVPHQALHDLPLHTLPPDPNEPGVPLGHRNPVCYAPSLAVLLHTLGGPPIAGRAAAVFGDPRGNLPWALAEARAVARSLGVQPATGSAVTREAVLAALREASTVHVAAHARASVDDGLTAGVDLAGEDVLRAADLLLAPVGADLVVLSGCETGVSEHRPGDEAVGLVRALLHGGAGALLTSQWRVNDRSAQRVLTAFHRYNATMARADALRQAMRAVAAEEGLDHFYHWGAFVLVGDWT